MTNQGTKEIRFNYVMALYGLLWYLSLILQLSTILLSLTSPLSRYFYKENSMTYKCLEDDMIEECSIVTERDWGTITALGHEVLKDGQRSQKLCSICEADKPGR